MSNITHSFWRFLWAIMKSHLNFKKMCPAPFLHFVWRSGFILGSDSCVICANIFKSKRWKTCCLLKYISWRRLHLPPVESKHLTLFSTFSLHFSLNHSHCCPEQVLNHKCDFGFDWLWWRSLSLWINTTVIWLSMWRREERLSHLGAKCPAGLFCERRVGALCAKGMIKTVFIILRVKILEITVHSEALM